jgi:hypothetical protein
MPTNQSNQEPTDEPVPAEPTSADVEETPTKEGTTSEVPAKQKKGKAFFFISRRYPGLKIQVQKMVDNKATGSQEQQVDEEASFTQFYDSWKGDIIRVGYLRTDSDKIAEACRNDENVEEIEEKEYTQAVEGDSKNKPLEKAPTVAA